MTLPVSGTISANMINTELKRSPTASFRIGNPTERALAGVPSGPIKFSDFRGKTWRAINWDGSTSLGPSASSSTLTVRSNGTWSAIWSVSPSGGGTGGFWTDLTTADNTTVRWSHVSGNVPNIGIAANTDQLLSSGDFVVGRAGSGSCQIDLVFRRSGITVGTVRLYLTT